MAEIRFVSMDMRKGFSFFQYGAEVALPEPSRPLRRIFSLIRSMGGSFLVEEDLEPNNACQSEIAALGKLNRRPWELRVKRISFFRTEQIVDFGTRREEALKTSGRNYNRFRELHRFSGEPSSGALCCLGYLYLYSYFSGTTAVQSYVHAAVVRDTCHHPSLHHRGKRLELTQMGEALPCIDFCSPHPERFVHSKAVYHPEIAGLKCHVQGSYFSEQQGMISRCAHCAINVSLKNTFAAYGLTPKMNFAGMNKSSGFPLPRPGRKVRAGLNVQEIKNILQEGGLASEFRNTDPNTKNPNGEFRPIDILAIAYHAVELGLPAILSFETDNNRGHVMTVVGHTFDSCQWEGVRAGNYFGNRPFEYLPSHTWVSGLVVQDDVIGPYSTLPLETLVQPGRNPGVFVPNFGLEDKLTPFIFELSAASAFFPTQKGAISYIESLEQSDEYRRAGGAGQWLTVLRDHVAKKDLVLHTTAMSGKAYIQYLTKGVDVQEDDSKKPIIKDTNVLKSVPDYIPDGPVWVVEISVPELYPFNTRKLGDVVLTSPQNGPSEVPWLLLVRVPGFVSFPKPDGTFWHCATGDDGHEPLCPQNNLTGAQGLLDKAKLTPHAWKP